MPSSGAKRTYDRRGPAKPATRRGRPSYSSSPPRHGDRERHLHVVHPPLEPLPVSEAFKALGLSEELLQALAREGVTDPFEIQSQAIPAVLAGRDLLGRAPTGSGKTLAFGLGVCTRIPKADPTAPSAVILVPTRELAQQVAKALMPYGRAMGKWIAHFVGGVAMDPQIRQLRRGTDIAIATPGRFIDLLERRELDLSKVSVVVLDEADRMADMGFMPQIDRLLSAMTAPRQTLLFSATLDRDVDALVQRELHNPYRVSVGETDDEALRRARHLVITTKHETKMDDLATLCRASNRAIVFVKNRFSTERWAAWLRERGVSAEHLHGGMTQRARENALADWARGSTKVLLATDLAARGVHVDAVDLVIHADPPQDEKDYIHRSGRTARAGADGLVVNLFRKEQLRPGAAMHKRLGVEPEVVRMSEALEALRTVQAGPVEVVMPVEIDVVEVAAVIPVVPVLAVIPVVAAALPVAEVPVAVVTAAAPLAADFAEASVVDEPDESAHCVPQVRPLAAKGDTEGPTIAPEGHSDAVTPAVDGTATVDGVGGAGGVATVGGADEPDAVLRRPHERPTPRWTSGRLRPRF